MDVSLAALSSLSACLAVRGKARLIAPDEADAFVKEAHVMQNEEKPQNLPEDSGSYIIVDNKVWGLSRHPSDFSVEEECEAVQSRISSSDDNPQAAVKKLAIGMCRVSVEEQGKRDILMQNVRQQSVAHHIYQIEETGEEIKITDRINLVLHDNDPEEVLKIIQEHKLVLEDRDEETCLLKVTDYSNSNPVRIANAIFRRDRVKSCVPEILFPMRAASAPAAVPGLSTLAGKYELFEQQWYLTRHSFSGNPSEVNASINVHGAWEKVQEQGGKFEESNIVIAVIDDGFDLKDDFDFRHLAFAKTRIDEVNMFNVVENDNDVTPKKNAINFHGTCVASLIVANGDESEILGVAPGCKLLPIRADISSDAKPGDLLRAFNIASRHAHVVNCSFSSGISEFPFVSCHSYFVKKLSRMIKEGGKDRHGLVIVFAAGNDNVPISMSGAENKTGIKRTVSLGNLSVADVIPAGKAVYGGYPEIPGVVVVGAMSSLKRKAFYSNWGKQLTVTAPSSSDHGLPVVAANNRVGIGDNLTPMDGHEDYTEQFGQTSAAAAIVSGVVGLMLSVNPKLTPADVCRILKDSADREGLDMKLEPDEASNLQGLDVGFDDDKHSIIFGGGKVDALAAVKAAL